jgi:primosomal protein N' (replication factor Y)
VSQEYFYSVIVKAKTTGLDVFTYKFSELLPNFAIVEIDFNGRKVLGMVIDQLSKPNFDPKRIKAITKLVDCSFLFDQTSLELSKIAADFYFTSLGKVVFWALPQIARRLADKEPIIFPDSHLSFPRRRESISCHSELVSESQKRSRNKFGMTKFLQADIWQRYKFYQKEIKKELQAGKQVLLLAPNLDVWFIKKLAQEFPTTIISPRGTISQKYLAYKKATQNKPQLVIGSQKALFAPLSNLSLILVEDEGNPLFKQEQDPKIEVSFLAKQLANLRGAKLVLAGLTPLPSTYLEIKEKKIELQKLFKEKSAQLVDLAQESKLLGFPTEMALKKSVRNHKKSILFFNRLGLAKLSLCPDCGFSSFLGHDKAGLAICPVCSGTKISGHSFGLDKLSYDLKKLFPRAEITDLNKQGFNRELGDITIATSFALKLETRFALSVLGLAEIGLSLADPMISYKIFHFAMEALSRGEKKIVQSFSPDHPLILALKNLDIDQFYKYWLALRRDLKLYPYYKTFKLKLANEADLEKVFKKLKKETAVEAVYQLKSEDEEYLLFSLDYQKPINPKLKSFLNKLRAKITIDPI